MKNFFLPFMLIACGWSSTMTAWAQSHYEVYAFAILAGSTDIIGSNNGTGTAARFNFPKGVTVDSAGNVYVGDSLNHTVRKITPTGVVSTLAGLAGSIGSADGTGSAARFNSPESITVDLAGNLYVADSQNHTIRKITPAGVVSTLAGLAGSRGSDDGTGSAARFNEPEGVAVDAAGNVYVGDSLNHTVRKITPAGVVSTLAGLAHSSGSANGTGSAARFNEPEGVAVGTAGNVYVADSQNHTVRKITPAGVVSTLAGLAGSSGSADGTGSAARFHRPQALAVDAAGNVYVADSQNHTIRKITPAGVVSTLAGSPGHPGAADGVGSAVRFDHPQGIAVDSAGTVYVADFDNQTIRAGAAAAAKGDFNGDGEADILWQNNSSGERVISLMNGTAFSSIVIFATVSTQWSIMGTSDFNGDGKEDILWQNNSSGQRVISLMNGTAVSSAANLGFVSTQWNIAGAGDFSGDGRADILLQNSVTGERSIWIMNGTIHSGTVSLVTVSTQWSMMGTGDFNGDGKADILWQNNSSGERVISLMNGTTFSSAVVLGIVSTEWSIAGAGDFSGDGKVDILWQNNSSGQRVISLMNGTAVSSVVNLGVVSTQLSIRNH